MKIIYSLDPSQPKQISRAHPHDSGVDLFLIEDVSLRGGERETINLGYKFKIEYPWYLKFLQFIGLGLEIQIRPKSGRSKAGIDVELGTVDSGYRNYVSATVTNITKKTITIPAGEKICQIVVAPVFNNVKFILGSVDAETSRGLGGFGSSGLK